MKDIPRTSHSCSFDYHICIPLLEDRETVEEITWSRKYWREELEELNDKPMWKNYRVHELLMTLVTLAMIWIFRSC